MYAMLKLDGRDVRATHHEGSRHFFAEEGVPMLGPNGVTGERNDIERGAADLCWSQTVDFLHEKLDPLQKS